MWRSRLGWWIRVLPYAPVQESGKMLRSSIRDRIHRWCAEQISCEYWCISLLCFCIYIGQCCLLLDMHARWSAYECVTKKVCTLSAFVTMHMQILSGMVYACIQTLHLFFKISSLNWYFWNTISERQIYELDSRQATRHSSLNTLRKHFVFAITILKTFCNEFLSDIVNESNV